MKKTKPFRWAGAALMALCGVVMLGGDKITSGCVLLLTALLLLLPLKTKLLKRLRLGFVCVVVCFVLWNISTTDLPTDHLFFSQDGVSPEDLYWTGIRFVDQIIHIVRGFLQGRLLQTR